ncbi:glpG protein [Spirochaetia bacterium]|nr:glpG protein [Spirochaetia bacterium]
MNIIRKPFRYQNNGAVYWIIGINILIFAATQFLGPEFRRFLTTRLCMIPVMVLKGWVWTFVSYMFMHGNFSHIIFNMLALFVFGTQVERYMGSREFVLFYFITGILAGVFSFIVYYLTGAYWIFLMGASGAVFAVELAYAVFFPDSIIYLWGILPLRAPVMVLGFTALELFFSITGRNTGVAHFTHLAGFGFAWLYFLIRLGMNPWRRLTGRRK